MKRVLSIKLTCNLILILNTLALIMHVLLLLKLIPYDFVWGGRLNSDSELVIFESISIFVQILFILIIAAKGGYFLRGKFKRTVYYGTWILFGVMVLNTIGNLFSISSLETIVMTPITALLALLLFRLAIEKNSK